jgi:hypothetical protein
VPFSNLVAVVGLVRAWVLDTLAPSGARKAVTVKLEMGRRIRAVPATDTAAEEDVRDSAMPASTAHNRSLVSRL